MRIFLPFRRRYLVFFFTATLALSVEASPPPELDLAKEAMPTDLDKAEEHIKLALKSAPDSAEVHFICGRIMGQQAESAFFSALSYAKQSLSCLKQAVALAPENIAYRNGLIAYYLGAPGFVGGDEKLAWKQVQMIAELDAQQGARSTLTYYRLTEQSDIYQAYLVQSQKQFPEYAEFHYRYGVLLQQQRRFAKAFAAFKAATEAHQDEAGLFRFNAWYQIGRTALFSQQQLAAGISALTYYIDNAPPSNGLPEKAWAHYRLARLFQLKGERTAMHEQLELASQSNDQELMREIRRLQ